MTVIAKVLEIVKLDLDDDVILAIENGSHVDLFEIYKIAEKQGPIQYNNIGVWSDKDGLGMTSTTKWYRRGNLKVCNQTKRGFKLCTPSPHVTRILVP